jgi:hypothetical protein
MGYRALYRVWRPQQFADFGWTAVDYANVKKMRLQLVKQVMHIYLQDHVARGKHQRPKFLLRPLIVNISRLVNLAINVKFVKQLRKED